MSTHFKRIMIFGRPGSGKSTFAAWLSQELDLDIHHLDKHFFMENWIERDHDKFLDIQRNIVNSAAWVVDGNSIGSLEMRWSKADLVLYFNFSRGLCLYRLLKRFFKPNKMFDDRAPGCNEVIRFRLLKYTWNFDKRVSEQIALLKTKYPAAVFKEIRNERDLSQLGQRLLFDASSC